MKFRHYLLGAIFIAALAGNAWARGVPIFQHPETHRSSAGNYELFVDPSEPSGAGSGVYTMRSAGKILWEEKLPFTLTDAVVTDDGFTVGYGYTAGLESMHRVADELVLCLVDPYGKVAAKKQIERVFPGFLDTPNFPWVNQMGYSSRGNVAWFFIREKDLNRGDGELIILDEKLQSIGEPFSILEKLNDGEGRIWQLQQVEGAPLLVMTWLAEGSGYRWKKYRISVVDFDGKEHWRWNADESDETQPMVSVTNRLQFRYTEKNETVTMKLAQSGNGWDAKELSRDPTPELAAPPTTDLPAVSDPLADVPVIEVQPFRTFTLDRPGTPEDAITIGYRPLFDGFGNVYLFGNYENPGTVRIINKKGELLRTNTIPSEGFSFGRDRAWVDHENLILMGKTEEISDHKSPWKLYQFDVSTGQLTQLSDDDFWGVRRIDASANGNILVRSYKSQSINSGGHIRVFDREGELLLRIDENDFSQGCGNCTVRDACLLSDGRIAILDTHPARVEILNLDGENEGVLLLAESWGYEPNYLSAVHAAPNGAIVVEDSNGRFPTVVMDATGKVLRKYRKRGIIDPFGKFWFSDVYTLKQESEEGEVLAMIGWEPTDELSGPMKHFHVDQDGRIYTVPARSGIPHVFNKNGELIYRADIPKDSIKNPETAAYIILLPGDGGMHYTVIEQVQSRDIPQVEQKYVFDAEGKHVVSKEVVGGISSDEVLMRTIGNNRDAVMINDGRVWTTEYHAVILKDLDGVVLKEVQRDVENNWLVGPRIAQQAPDGGILVRNSPRTANSQRNFTIYSSEAEVLGGFKMPNPPGIYLSNSAWNGKYLFVFEENQLLVINDQGEYVKALNIPGANKSWQPHSTKDGTELWLFDGGREVVCLRIEDFLGE